MPARTLTQRMRGPFRWRPEDSERERLKVLGDGGEMELVARTRKPPKPHTLEAMVGFQMRELHLLSRDLANAFVFIFRRATSRASSWRSRGILRASALVQHFALIGHTSQSRFEAR
jgi:hypothetical protein